MKILIMFFILVKKIQISVLKYSIQYKDIYYITYINTVDKKDFDKFLSKHFNFFLIHKYSFAEILSLYKGDISTFVEIQIMKLITITK